MPAVGRLSCHELANEVGEIEQRRNVITPETIERGFDMIEELGYKHFLLV